MRHIGLLADRMLAIVAPKVTAQASCCGYQSYTIPCGCTGGFEYEKVCWTDCCQSGCGTCFKTGKTC